MHSYAPMHNAYPMPMHYYLIRVKDSIKFIEIVLLEQYREKESSNRNTMD